jgi:protein-S-isoprenylcysteine O-methyltransferase Ste14
MDRLVIGANVACWGAVVVVWVAAAVRDAGTRRTERIRGTTDIGITVLGIAAIAAILLAGRTIFGPFTVDAMWARLLGAGVLVGSTLFAIRARLALGRSWSIGPRAALDRGLRTDGPYAITRHPIYTGLLGMLVGSALLAGLGQAIELVPIGLVVAWLKIRAEERLLLATFPGAYPAYRERVPGLVPGWRILVGRWRRSP